MQIILLLLCASEDKLLRLLIKESGCFNSVNNRVQVLDAESVINIGIIVGVDYWKGLKKNSFI